VQCFSATILERRYSPSVCRNAALTLTGALIGSENGSNDVPCEGERYRPNVTAGWCIGRERATFHPVVWT
jgi:hypothetical protein